MVIFSKENSAGPASLTAQPESDNAVAMTSIFRCRDVIVGSLPHDFDSGAVTTPEDRIAIPTGRVLPVPTPAETDQPTVLPQLA